MPIDRVWALVSDMDHWAPLIPGYVTHQKVSDRESLWTLKGDVGVLNKTIIFRVTITEWTEPTRVRFTMKATNDNVEGSGYFLAEEERPDLTRLTGYLDLRPGGAMAPMVSALMKPVMPKITAEFAETLARKIEEG